MGEPERHSAAMDAHLWDRLPRPIRGGWALLAGAACVAAVTAVCSALSGWLPAHGVAMFYILAVVASAIAFGMLAGMASATTAFLAYNYFFLKPYYTFTIADPRDLVALFAFFVVAIAAGSLAGRLREVAEQARLRSRSLQFLNTLAMRLSRRVTAGEIAEIIVSEASKAAGQPALMLRATDGNFEVLCRISDAPRPNTSDLQAAQRCVSTRQKVYPAAAGWPGSHYEFRPLSVRDSVVAVLGIHQSRFDDANDATIDSMVQQAAAAMERLSLEAEKRAVEKEVETERLRSVLLSSVSHDTKTPLSVILGAVTSLRELGSKLPEESRTELLATIEEETAHLLRFVTNMLDMMRLQSGLAEAGIDWVDLVDSLGTTVARARKSLAGGRISLDTQVSPAIVRGDETLLEHVFLNVIGNAVNASAPDGVIRVTLRTADTGYCVEIEDSGTGIEPDVLPRIFDKFFRAPGTKTRGAGLGLTICKEVMKALGGSIAAQSPIAAARGTRITLRFPNSLHERHVEPNHE